MTRYHCFISWSTLKNPERKGEYANFSRSIYWLFFKESLSISSLSLFNENFIFSYLKKLEAKIKSRKMHLATTMRPNGPYMFHIGLRKNLSWEFEQINKADKIFHCEKEFVNQKNTAKCMVKTKQPKNLNHGKSRHSGLVLYICLGWYFDYLTHARGFWEEEFQLKKKIPL